MFVRKIGEIFFAMFELKKSFSEIKLSEKFSKRVLDWLGNNENYLKQAYKQVNNNFVNGHFFLQRMSLKWYFHVILENSKTV